MKYCLLVYSILLLLLLATGCAPQKGDAGNNGQDGNNGLDGTQVGIVKLCPGSTAYPGTFVEIAFCINNKLYAVYSTHGGFQTEIPPGVYSSNGVGNNCNFRVLPNCGIEAL